MAREAGLTEHDVLEALLGLEARTTTSLDAPVASASTATLGDFAAVTPDPSDNLVDLVALADVVDCLSPADRQLLDLRFGRELTQQKMADILGCSQMQICRQLRRLHDRLRALLVA